MRDASGALSPLFTWRSALTCEASPLNSSQRLVGLVLSLHMNEVGASCFPGHDRLAHETGLHRVTVTRAVRDLERRGFLRITARDRADGQFTTHDYEAVIPASVRDATRVAQGYTDHVAQSRSHVAPGYVDHVAQRYTRATVRANPRASGESVSQRARAKPMQRSAQFDEFWTAYPRKVGKRVAALAFARRVAEGASPQELVAGAQRYAEWIAAGAVESPRFIAHPTTWLNQGREADVLADPSSMRNGQRRKAYVTEAWDEIERRVDAAARVASDQPTAVRRLPATPRHR